MPTCISIASRPGVLGTTLFGAGFSTLNIPWTYQARKVANEDELRSTISELREGNIRGCGVSMPWKTKVMPYLDALDPSAERIGAVNTIVYSDGRLRGYNTDYIAARRVYQDAKIGKGSRVLILGAGGVARAHIVALTELGAKVTLSAREPGQMFTLVDRYDIEPLDWEERTLWIGDVLVNCTPVGMEPDKGVPLDVSALRNVKIVADLVIKPPRTKLLISAEKAHRKTLPGTLFALEQALEQFRIYVEREPPRDEMESALQAQLHKK